MPTLVALVALLAFAPQAGATDYEEKPVGACAATDSGYDDPCSAEEPKPEPMPEPDPVEKEPEPDEAKPEGDQSCDDDHAARPATSREGEDRFEDGCLPQFVRRFISRVWKFVGEVDYYEDGELSMTLGKILNLPRKWRTQDDELLDQDATVLVSNRVRVFENGERVGRDALDAANDVRVHGKLLRPRMWRTDDDGSPVPTIRAKKIYITG
jgi:hypothetical protein